MNNFGGEIQTGNIHTNWLNNIYENIKNIENTERLAREGCESLLEYVMMPPKQRRLMLGEIQYKNLRIMITEFQLLISDLTPYFAVKKNKDDPADKVDFYLKAIKAAQSSVDKEGLFVDRIKNQHGQTVSTELTPFFWDTLNYLATLKRQLFKDIAPILYMDNTVPF